MGGDILDWITDHVFPWLMIGVIVLVIAGIIILPLAIYAESKEPTFSLKKADWHCTASHDVSSTTYIKSGNLFLPITTYSKHCDQWSANP